MIFDLEKEDIISLVLGTSPYYTIFENTLVKRCGRFFGGFRDEWQWERSILETLNDVELKELYFLCKNSWK